MRPDTLCIDPQEVYRLVTERTRAVICVDYAGQPCDYDAVTAAIARKLAELGRRDTQKVWVLGDASHSYGALYKNQPVGNIAGVDACACSFHPVKNLTTGEGGLVLTNDKNL